MKCDERMNRGVYQIQMVSFSLKLILRTTLLYTFEYIENIFFQRMFSTHSDKHKTRVTSAVDESAEYASNTKLKIGSMRADDGRARQTSEMK